MGVNKLSWFKDMIILLVLVTAAALSMVNEIYKAGDRDEFYSEVRRFMDKGNRYTPEMERQSIIDHCEHLNSSRVILGQPLIDCEKHADELVKREWKSE